MARVHGRVIAPPPCGSARARVRAAGAVAALWMQLGYALPSIPVSEKPGPLPLGGYASALARQPDGEILN